jgi:glycosyltransferase involved in cell wall biosynthesis
METERLRVAMFSTMVAGGAGYAALRVHDALRLGGADSTLYVGRAERAKHPGVIRIREAEEGVQPAQIPGWTIFSVDPPGIPDTDLDRIIARSDIFNLHWCARFLSLRNIGRLSRSGKPVVLTIRDMNPLAGGCHFFHGCENWKRDCSPCPQFHLENLPLPQATFESKRSLWNYANVAVVVLSDHTRRLVKQSPLLGECRVEKIPNPIDVSIFKPYDRERARAEFGIPPGKRAIAYLPSFSSSVKGAAQAMQALRHLAAIVPADDCVVLCAGDLEEPLDVPFKTISARFIFDRRKLVRFYSSADVTLIPSLEETFSNTAAESVACGTPVVGFQVGAIPEIAQGARGRAVPADHTKALAHALGDVLSSERPLPTELHAYVKNTFSAAVVGLRYVNLFEELCRQQLISPVRDTGGARVVSSLVRLLDEYRERRLPEIEREREERKRERRSIRALLGRTTRIARMFIFDHRAFWRNVGTALSERR